MITTLETLRDVFAIFHDGSVDAWEGNESRLKLTIGCRYLAERIDRTFERFYVAMSAVSILEFDPWYSPEIPGPEKRSLPEIFGGWLEILAAEMKEDHVVVVCSQQTRT